MMHIILNPSENIFVEAGGNVEETVLVELTPQGKLQIRAPLNEHCKIYELTDKGLVKRGKG